MSTESKEGQPQPRETLWMATKSDIGGTVLRLSTDVVSKPRPCVSVLSLGILLLLVCTGSRQTGWGGVGDCICKKEHTVK